MCNILETFSVPEKFEWRRLNSVSKNELFDKKKELFDEKKGAF